LPANGSIIAAMQHGHIFVCRKIANAAGLIFVCRKMANAAGLIFVCRRLEKCSRAYFCLP
jgi:hypothetical protein